MKIKIFLKNNKFVRELYFYLREIKWLLFSFLYDIKRFFIYGGWRKRKYLAEERNYYTMFLYHKIEKSMSYKNRNPKSGWNDILELVDSIEIAYKTNDYMYHDIAAKQVIEKFLRLPENINDLRVAKIRERIATINFFSPDEHGVITKTKDELQKGILEKPEEFFFSRYSVREFENRKIDIAMIKQGINLARKTPSVCNRQHWRAYHTDSDEVKKLVLELQNGNRGFGHTIPNLMVITTDLNAFFTTNEHKQGLIDGGMYLMSLIYAYHSLGISCCALNWAQTPKNDKELRKRVKIRDQDSIICILALGYPQESNTVCASTRLPSDEFLINLEGYK